MTSLSNAEAGKGKKGKGLSPATMESARRFLYDEDVPTPTRSMPVQPPRSTNLSHGDKRLNPIQAAFMETMTTCQTYGNKRSLYIIGFIVGIVLLSLGIHHVNKDTDEQLVAQRFQAMQSKIVESQVTSEEDINTVGSVQYQALKWLSNNDESAIAADDESLISRYIMAVFFYSFSVDKNHIEPISGWKTQTNWMTDKGYCDWYGVICVEDVDGNDNVQEIKLNGNKLQGSLPSELTGLSALNILNLMNNKVGGTLPTELAKVQDLRYLLLSNNMIEGTIPTEFGSFLAMRHLDLGSNQLTGSIPSELQKSFTMQELHLQDNQLGGHMPEFVEFEALTTLDLGNNNLVGTLPPAFAKLTTLYDLRLSNNTLTGQLPAEMEAMVHLRMFFFACGTLCLFWFPYSFSRTIFIVSFSSRIPNARLE